MSTAHWAQISLKDATSKVATGATPTGGKDSYRLTGIPLIRSQNVRFEGFLVEGLVYIDATQAARLSNATVRERDVLLTITGGSIGRVTLAPREMDGARVNQHVAIIRPLAGLDASFLRWFLASPALQHIIATIQSGVTRPALTREMILNFQIPLPPFAEQCRIATRIDELFTALNTAKQAVTRATENLRNYRSAVLQSAADGSLTAAWRSQHKITEPGSALLQRILHDRRRAWESTQLRSFANSRRTPPKHWQAKYVEPTPPTHRDLPELPTTWCWTTIDQLGHIKVGLQRSPRNRSKDNPTKYIRAANLTEEGLDLTNVLEMDFTPTQRETYRLHKGDLLFAEASGSPDQVGKPAVWDDQLPLCCFQNTIIRLRPAIAISDYLLVVFRHYYFNKVLVQYTTGVGINHLSLGRFSKVPVPLPPLSEQTQIVAEATRNLVAIAKGMSSTNAALDRTDLLNQDVLRSAFNGTLVAADPADEPTSALLDRLRWQKQAAEAEEKDERKRERREARPEMPSHTRRPLLAVLKEHPEGMTPEDLLREVGYTPADIDAFYAELRDIAPEIEEIRPSSRQLLNWPKGVKVILRPKKAN